MLNKLFLNTRNLGKFAEVPIGTFFFFFFYKNQNYIGKIGTSQVPLGTSMIVS